MRVSTKSTDIELSTKHYSALLVPSAFRIEPANDSLNIEQYQKCLCNRSKFTYVIVRSFASKISPNDTVYFNLDEKQCFTK